MKFRPTGVFPDNVVAINAKAPPTDAGKTRAMFSPSKLRTCLDSRIPAVSVWPNVRDNPVESSWTILLKFFFAVLMKLSIIIYFNVL
jgi:hypothetical protein